MMRAWIYDSLVFDVELQSLMNAASSADMMDRIMPRHSRSTVNIPKPYIIYGMGTDSNEALAEANDHVAHRQFWEVWVHDESGDFTLIEDIVERVKDIFRNAADVPSMVSTTNWLETSSEFNNDTYGTIFRYIRFQSIISKGVAA